LETVNVAAWGVRAVHRSKLADGGVTDSTAGAGADVAVAVATGETVPVPTGTAVGETVTVPLGEGPIVPVPTGEAAVVGAADPPGLVARVALPCAPVPPEPPPPLDDALLDESDDALAPDAVNGARMIEIPRGDVRA
jgi:hypothetical protein